MIEIIYRGDEEEKNDVDVKLPRNVRQIGDCERDCKKIYVEDFVMTYVKHFSTRKLKYGVLLGTLKNNNGNTYIFINGAVCANALLDNEIIFDEDVWTGIYEDIKQYFDDVEIVGWFASIPSILPNDMPQIQKLHLDNFAGNNKMFFLLDRLEGEDTFYIYDDGGMKPCEGFYIYYEKNADMQAYMSMHIDTQTVPEEYEQTKKAGIQARVHKLFESTNFNFSKLNNKHEEMENKTKENNVKKPVEYKPVEFGNIDYLKKNHNNQQSENGQSNTEPSRRLPTFAYSASSFMLIAILVGTIALMNASGQLKELKNTVAGFVGSKSIEGNADGNNNNENDDNANIIDVNGNVETTTQVNETTAIVEEQTTDVMQVNQTENIENAQTEEQVNNQQQESTMPVASISAPEKAISYYVIQSGDSLYSISLKTYGDAAMVDQIKQANNIVNENKIKEGETIVLP